MIPRPKPERFRLRRTMMFMNAQKPGLIKDAYIYGCDSIMLDLEDAVAENQKDAARFSLYHALKTIDYGDTEVAVLRQIKLMRKLGVPLEEIRRMQAGGTVADGMRRHLVTLERERHSLEQSIQLCSNLKDREERLDTLDAAALLEEMEQLEQKGTTFQDLSLIHISEPTRLL